MNLEKNRHLCNRNRIFTFLSKQLTEMSQIALTIVNQKGTFNVCLSYDYIIDIGRHKIQTNKECDCIKVFLE